MLIAPPFLLGSPGFYRSEEAIANFKNVSFGVTHYTYKKPRFTQDEISGIMDTGTDEEKAAAFAFTKSRDGYETVPGKSYVGITKQTWQKRYCQHVEDAIVKVSGRKFHEAIREMQGEYVIHVHDIVACAVSHEDALAIEKKLINDSTLWPNGLNMRA